MEARKIIAVTVVMAVLLILAGGLGLALAQGPTLGAAVGTAFTYQGQLIDQESPATGTYDFEFELHDHATSGSQVGSAVYVDDLYVSDGLFTTKLDFGSGVFTGEARYLEIAVRPGDSTDAYTTLAPRQELTAAPYALHSLSTGSLQGYPVSDTLPTTGQLLRWNGTAWEPATVASTNQPPVAILQADPAVLMPGDTTTLSLTLSYDPEGGHLYYAFDPTGQAFAEPSIYGKTPSTVVAAEDYEVAGDYLAAGWVKDEAGSFDVARALISVYRFWTTTVDSAAGVESGSLAVVHGRPAVAYQDFTNGDLKYVRALDPTGSSWGTPVTVNSGRNPSLAVVDGYPAIAYQDGTNDDLKYVRATSATGSSWGTPVTPDASGGGDTSLVVVDGNPAIAYYHPDNEHLKYVRADDATGSSWGTPVFADSTEDVGYDASLVVVNGNPAIAYFDYGNNDVKYVRADDATGSSWGTPVTVHSNGTEIERTSLAVVDGHPAVACYDAGPNYDLVYVRATDATGSSWGAPVTVDSTAGVGLHASLAVVNGNPAIAYNDGPNYDLKYVRANDATGSSWPTPITADSTGRVGTHPSLVVVDGRPAIAYDDSTGYKWTLRFAIPRQW